MSKKVPTGRKPAAPSAINTAQVAAAQGNKLSQIKEAFGIPDGPKLDPSTPLIDYPTLELDLIRQMGHIDEVDQSIITHLAGQGFSVKEMIKAMAGLQKALDAMKPARPAPRASDGDEAVSKVLKALAGKPELTWKLAQELNRVVLSPWKWAADGQDPPKGQGRHIKGHRDYATGRGVVACRVYQVKLDGSHNSWSWTVFGLFAHMVQPGGAGDLNSVCGSQEEAVAIVDGHLASRGYILPDG